MTVQNDIYDSSASAQVRVQLFCDQYELRVPVLMAPMAGACPPELAVAVVSAGGMGACGALLMTPADIETWVAEFRQKTNGGFQLNNWVPDPEPVRNVEHEQALGSFLKQWGPAVPAEAADVPQLDFDQQCDTMLSLNPRVMSSIMGLYPEHVVQRMKSAGIAWFANATTVTEALMAEAAGADVIVAQGMEAGGHRGAFNANDAQTDLVGLFSLLPAIVDAVKVPVVAAGGVSHPRAVAAALTLGASAVQIGTALLRSTQANTPPALAAAMATARPESTVATRAFSGRLGRSLKTAYTVAAEAQTAPEPAAYPVQRNLTAPMRKQAIKNNDIDAMQAWAGQSCAYAKAKPAESIIDELWREARRLLP